MFCVLLIRHCALKLLLKNSRSRLEVQNTSTTQKKLLYAYIIVRIVRMFWQTQKTLTIKRICLMRLSCNTALNVFASRMIKMFVVELIGGKGCELTFRWPTRTDINQAWPPFLAPHRRQVFTLEKRLPKRRILFLRSWSTFEDFQEDDEIVYFIMCLIAGVMACVFEECVQRANLLA